MSAPDHISGWLRRIMARVEAGHLGDPERAAQAERERLRLQREEQRRAWERQEAHLSQEHLAKARDLMAGKLHPVSDISRQLSRATDSASHASVLLVGPTGAGKTTAVTAYALSRIRAGWVVFHVIEHHWKGIARHEERMEEIILADLVIFDQLQKIRTGNWVSDAVTSAIDSRYQRTEAQTLGCLKGSLDDVPGVLEDDVVERFDRVIVTDETSYRQRGTGGKA